MMKRSEVSGPKSECAECGVTRGDRGRFAAWAPAFFKNDPPPPRNLYDETKGELQAKVDLQPQMLAAESAYRPQYAALDLADLQSLLNGTPGGKRQQEYTDYETVPAEYRPALPGEKGYSRQFNGRTLVRDAYQLPITRTQETDVPAQRGLLDILENDLMPASDRITGQTLTRQRESEIGDVENLGPRATAAFRASNPDQAALLDQLNAQAKSELEMGATLDPSLAREVQQSVRAGQSARGMGLGMNDLADEGLFTGMQAEQLRRARQQFAQGMVGINAATTTDPFMAVLGRPGVNLQQGNGLLGQGMNMNRTAGPQLFGSSVNANDVFDSNFNAANASAISGNNNTAAMTGAGIAGGASLAAAGIFAAAL